VEVPNVRQPECTEHQGEVGHCICQLWYFGTGFVRCGSN
jgi:hypothetical protein